MDAREALAKWVAEERIDADLAAELEATLDSDARERSSSGIISIIVGVGTLLIGGGLMLFIASQWDVQSPARRLLLLSAVYALVVAVAALAGRQRLSTTARWLWFLSSLAVGANVFLVGQIFNLSLAHWQGTGLWMVAALAMGLANGDTAHGWLVVVLAVLTVGWVSVPSAEFFDQAAFLFDDRGIKALLALLGLSLVSGAALMARTPAEFVAPAARGVGGLLVAVPIVVSTFDADVFEEIFDLDLRLFHAVVVIGCVAVLGFGWWSEPHPMVAAAALAGAAFMVMVLPQAADGGRSRGSGPWLAEHFRDSEVLFGVYGAVVLALALGVAVAGRALDSAALVNAAMACAGVLLLGLYIGRIAGALPTSLAVVGGGVLLVGGGVVLERKRRDLLGGESPVAVEAAS